MRNHGCRTAATAAYAALRSCRIFNLFLFSMQPVLVIEFNERAGAKNGNLGSKWPGSNVKPGGEAACEWALRPG